MVKYTSKKNKETNIEDIESSEDENLKHTKKKIDRRSETSKQNSIKARQAKLEKLKKNKTENQNKIQKELIKSTQQETENTVSELPIFEDDEESEILIINPPPIDENKLQKKLQQIQQTQEIYEWIQQEKNRRQNKIKNDHNPVSPVVINMPSNTPTKNLNENDEILKQKLILQCQSNIKF